MMYSFHDPKKYPKNHLTKKEEQVIVNKEKSPDEMKDLLLSWMYALGGEEKYKT